MFSIFGSDGAVGTTGYSYTIGTGGHAIVDMLQRHLAPRLLGREAEWIEQIGGTCCFTLMRRRSGPSPLWPWRRSTRRCGICAAAGRASRCRSSPAVCSARCLYTTEGGWLHIETELLVEDALRAKQSGFGGSKVKVGRPRMHKRGR